MAALVAASVKVARQWEKAVILRLGKFKKLAGPGIFMVIPIVDSVSSWVDQRVIATSFNAEQTLTKDTVPVDVDAENKPVALHLRAMNILYEGLKEKGALVVVPSTAVETMGLGGVEKMNLIYLQAIGFGVFVMSAFALGTWLRRHPSKKAAEVTTRIMHFFLIFAVIIPMSAGFTDPGLNYYDELLGIPSLPFQTILLAVGVVMMLIGFGFFAISIVVLFDHGEGLLAFELTKKLAAKDIYERTRNPMSLGFYLMCIGMGLFAGSTFFTLWSLLAFIPAHVFFLKYFEESELEIRFGQSYVEYKKRVPFLIPNFRKPTS